MFQYEVSFDLNCYNYKKIIIKTVRKLFIYYNLRIDRQAIKKESECQENIDYNLKGTTCMY